MKPRFYTTTQAIKVLDSQSERGIRPKPSNPPWIRHWFCILSNHLYALINNIPLHYTCTIQQEKVRGENLYDIRDFIATCESFLHEMLGMSHPIMRSV